MSRLNRAMHGLFSSYLFFSLNILYQVLVLPLLIKKIGNDQVGIYLFLFQLFSYFQLIEIGIVLSATRFISQKSPTFFSKKTDKVSELVFSYLRTISFLNAGIILLICIVYLILSNAGFQLNVFKNFEKQSIYIMFLFAFSNIVKSIFSPYQTGLTAKQQIAAFNYINIIGLALKLLLTIWLSKFGLILVFLGILLSDILVSFFSYVRYVSLFGASKLKLNFSFSDKLFKQIASFSINIYIINLAGKLVFQSDLLIIGNFLPAFYVTMFACTQQVGFLLNNIAMKFTDVATPAINELYNLSDSEKLKNIYLSLHKYTLSILIPIFWGICLLNSRVVEIWVGRNNYAGMEMSVCLAIFSLFLVMAHIDNAFVTAKGNMRNLTRLTICEGLLNLILSIYFLRWFGLWGVMLATTIANIPTSMYLLITGAKVHRVSINEYFSKIIRPLIIPGCFIMLAIASIKAMEISSIIFFFSAIILSVLVYLMAIYFFSLESTEKRKLWDIINLRK